MIMVDIAGFQTYLERVRKYPHTTSLRYVMIVRSVIEIGCPESQLMADDPDTLAIMVVGHLPGKAVIRSSWRPGIKRYREFVEWTEQQEKIEA